MPEALRKLLSLYLDCVGSFRGALRSESCSCSCVGLWGVNLRYCFMVIRSPHNQSSSNSYERTLEFRLVNGEGGEWRRPKEKRVEKEIRS